MATDIDAQKERSWGTILIVEDDESNRELLISVIETETPYKPFVVGSGYQTLHHIKQIIEAKPLLFILDYRLPSMTGFDLYDCLHSYTELAQQPAIMLTAMNRDEQIEQAAAQRHIEVLAKPFDLEDLVRCIEQTIQGCSTTV